MYKYVTIKCSMSDKLKEDYREIIEDLSKQGYAFISMVPIFIKTRNPSQYDLIFKKYRKWE